MIYYDYKVRVYREKYKRRELVVYLLLNKEKSFQDIDLKFEVSIEAAKSNWEKLYIKNFDLSDYTTNSLLDPKFEFNRIDYLEMVLYNHLLWNKLKDMVINGILYSLNEISEPNGFVRLQLNID